MILTCGFVTGLNEALESVTWTYQNLLVSFESHIGLCFLALCHCQMLFEACVNRCEYLFLCPTKFWKTGEEDWPPKKDSSLNSCLRGKYKANLENFSALQCSTTRLKHPNFLTLFGERTVVNEKFLT